MERGVLCLIHSWFLSSPYVVTTARTSILYHVINYLSSFFIIRINMVRCFKSLSSEPSLEIHCKAVYIFVNGVTAIFTFSACAFYAAAPLGLTVLRLIIWQILCIRKGIAYAIPYFVYSAGVAFSCISQRFLSCRYRRRVVATKFTTSNNLFLLYIYYTAFIL